VRTAEPGPPLAARAARWHIGAMMATRLAQRRPDPYRNFKFRVVWDGRPVAGVSRVSGLAWEADVVEVREGNAPDVVQKHPGTTRFDAVRLERGITQDTAFEQWAGQRPAPQARRDVQIELLDRRGRLVRRWTLRRCWVSRFEALSPLGTEATAAAIESITLQFDGWESVSP
jgi:phage tail-like protein